MVTNQKKFDCGHVIECRPGCYKGVVVIDGNSLYGSIMLKLSVFEDRCASAIRTKDLCTKKSLKMPGGATHIAEGDVISIDSVMIMRNESEDMAIIRFEPTILSRIFFKFISIRADAKANKNVVLCISYLILLVSVYGAMVSKKGVLSSKRPPRTRPGSTSGLLLSARSGVGVMSCMKTRSRSSGTSRTRTRVIA